MNRTPAQSTSHGTDDERSSGGDLSALFECFERYGRRLVLARHQKLALEPASSDELFLVIRGLVHVGANVGGERLLLSVCRSGDVIGASCLMHLPGIEARAAEQTELLEVNSRKIRSVCLPEAGVSLRQLEIKRTADLARHVLMLGRMSGEERLAYFLLQESRRGAAVDEKRVKLDLGLSRSDIADYLALNPDTLSRILARFRRMGAITTSSRRSITVNLSRLRELIPSGSI